MKQYECVIGKKKYTVEAYTKGEARGLIKKQLINWLANEPKKKWKKVVLPQRLHLNRI